MFLCLALVCAMPRAAPFHGTLEGVAEGAGDRPWRLLTRARADWHGGGLQAGLESGGPAHLYALYGERRRGPWRARAGRLPVGLHALDGARLDWRRRERRAWAYGGRPRGWDDVLPQALPARLALGVGQGAWTLEGQWPAAVVGQGRWRRVADGRGWDLAVDGRLRRGVERLRGRLTRVRGGDRLRLGIGRHHPVAPATGFSQALALAYAPGRRDRLELGWSRRQERWDWDLAGAVLRRAPGATGEEGSARLGYRDGRWSARAQGLWRRLGREWRQGLAFDLDLRAGPRWRLNLAAAAWRGATTLAGARTDLAAELRLRHRPAPDQRLDLRLALAAGTPAIGLAWVRRFHGAGP